MNKRVVLSFTLLDATAAVLDTLNNEVHMNSMENEIGACVYDVDEVECANSKP